MIIFQGITISFLFVILVKCILIRSLHKISYKVFPPSMNNICILKVNIAKAGCAGALGVIVDHLTDVQELILSLQTSGAQQVYVSMHTK